MIIYVVARCVVMMHNTYQIMLCSNYMSYVMVIYGEVSKI